jgi:beta-aspartyl-peptidase (threonine type)
MLVLASHEGSGGIEQAITCLKRGGTAVDAVELGIRPIEADPAIHSVGKGGYPNLLGEVECDAAIMDGKTLQVGAVGALRATLHAISVARQVMERLPHAMLAGSGAERFAEEIRQMNHNLLTSSAKAAFERWKDRRLSAADRARWPDGALSPYAWPAPDQPEPKDTIVFIAVDRDGNIAAGGSTSGWAYKYPGRLSDSGIVGAGLYADNRYGACVCTHTGEMVIRASTARSVILYMKNGASVEEACDEAIQDLRDLIGGLRGPVIIHAVDRRGESCVVALGEFREPPVYYLWTDATHQTKQLNPLFEAF